MRRTQPVIYRSSSPSVLRAFPVKISWLGAKPCAPQTVEEPALQVPALLAFSYFLQSLSASHLSEAKGLRRKKTLPYNSIQNPQHQGAGFLRAQRRGFRHMLRFSVAVLSKAKDMMLQSRQSAIRGAKTNKTQTK